MRAARQTQRAHKYKKKMHRSTAKVTRLIFSLPRLCGPLFLRAHAECNCAWANSAIIKRGAGAGRAAARLGKRHVRVNSAATAPRAAQLASHD